MPFRVVRQAGEGWVDRPNQHGVVRRTLDVTGAGELTQSRACIWRYPPRSYGRRHRELAQEEVFVVLDGTLTMLIGDPPERVDVERGDVVTLAIGTEVQVRNETDDEVVVFAYGAPPVTGQAEILADVD
jgi:mannose-6-phosphate isomerase-like protein (cupin superfamily)